MKYLLLVLFSAFSVIGFCQKFSSIDFSLGAGATGQHLSGGSTLDVNIDSIIGARNLNWQVGVAYNKGISDRYYLGAGLQLSKIGYKRLDIWFPRDGGGYWIGDAFMGANASLSEYNFYFLDLPMIVGVRLKEGRFSSYSEVGLITSYLMCHSVNNLNLNNSVLTTAENNLVESQVYSAFTFSVGAKYRLSSSMEIYLQPTFRQQLKSLYGKGSLIDGYTTGLYLYTMNLEVGFRRNL